MAKKSLPLAPIERILRNAGAERISEDAAEALRTVIEDMAESMAAQTVKIAKHAGRKTVQAGDVKLAK